MQSCMSLTVSLTILERILDKQNSLVHADALALVHADAPRQVQRHLEPLRHHSSAERNGERFVADCPTHTADKSDNRTLGCPVNTIDYGNETNVQSHFQYQTSSYCDVYLL